MVSASCPNCTIYLVESNTNDASDTPEKAETEAVKLGARITSNSFICYGSLDMWRPKIRKLLQYARRNIRCRRG